MSENDNPFKLTPEENKAHFDRKVLPKLAAGTKSVWSTVHRKAGAKMKAEAVKPIGSR